MNLTTESAMNLKLNNDVKCSVNDLKAPVSQIKEERRRTGRYIAILVGMLLFILAIYHAWVRRIPIVASLVVPALIMFVYVAWVLYTASRDKHRLLDLEAAIHAQALEAAENDGTESTQNAENAAITSRENSNVNSPEGSVHNWSETIDNRSNNVEYIVKENNIQKEPHHFTMPIILINDKPPEDLDQKWSHIVDKVSTNDKLKYFTAKRNYKRKFCRRRHAVYKRSYSIG